jgi:hypothetical protein
MASNKSIKVLKTGVPKLKDLKDHETQFNVNVPSVEILKQVFDAAIPQLGRDLSKSNYHYGRKTIVGATEVAANSSSVLSDIDNDGIYARRMVLSEAAGYTADSWKVTNKCNDVRQWDWEDIYESNAEVEVIIRIVRKVKNKEELAKAGIK